MKKKRLIEFGFNNYTILLRNLRIAHVNLELVQIPPLNNGPLKSKID